MKKILMNLRVKKPTQGEGIVYIIGGNLILLLKFIFQLLWSIFQLLLYLLKKMFGCFCSKRVGASNKVGSKGSKWEDSSLSEKDFNVAISRMKSLKENQFIGRFLEVMRFYESNSASIEIDVKGRVHFIPFIYIPYFRFLPKDLKTEFNDTVDRSSRDLKVRGLIFKHKKIINSSRNTYNVDRLVKNIEIIKVFYKYLETLKLITFLLGIALNIIILVAYSTVDNPTEEDDLQTVKFKDENTERLRAPYFLISKQVGFAMAAFNIIVIMVLHIRHLPQIKEYLVSEEGWKLFQFYFSSGVFYYLLYLACTFLGMFIHPFFFAFALTDCINRFSTMKIIFRAIYLPRKSLMLTLCLILIFCYVFALVWYSSQDQILNIAAQRFPDNMPELSEASNQNRFPDVYSGTAGERSLPDVITKKDNQYCCKNMLLCFVCLIDNLIKNDAKVGTVMSGENNQKPLDYDFWIFGYDNVVLIVLKLLLMEILSGLIIDTFGALRDQDISKNLDLKGSCFVCGLTVEEFERPGCVDFDTHIETEHYMWNYIAFLAYLQEKEPDDYDGIELYVTKEINNTSISWVPNGTTFFLDQNQNSAQWLETLEVVNKDADQIGNKVQRIKMIMKNIGDQFKEQGKEEPKKQKKANLST
jgi:inositol 1,4,5-triphosphate receptor type 3